jgi:hypothetical protein
MDNAGNEGASLGVIQDRVADDDDEVAGVHQARGRPIDSDDPAAGRPLDDIGLQAGAVVDVNDMDLLPGKKVGCPHELRVHRHRSHVVQVGLGDGRAVYFRLQHGSLHGVIPFDASSPRVGTGAMIMILKSRR